METIDTIPIDARTRLLVLTGAGISAESGLATFRAAGGLWQTNNLDDVASVAGFDRDSGRVWAFHDALREAVAGAAPNAAHLALAECEAAMGDRFLLATQNVDGLHARAGSQRTLELHGSLWRTRCADCDRQPWADFTPHDPARTCDRCGGRPRPAVVWFGEQVDVEAHWRTKRFIKESEWADEPLVFLAIGTSGSVAPASGLARYARDFGAATWLANLDLADNSGDFDHCVQGQATTLVPALLRQALSSTQPAGAGVATRGRR